MDIVRKQPTVEGPSDWFTGEVWIDTVVQPKEPSHMNVAAVHFAPGARTAWHTHEGGQSLYVIEGSGRAQARVGPMIHFGAGDVVHTPSGEWHWHGAGPDHFMTHLSLTEGPASWGEHVSDDQYRGG